MSQILADQAMTINKGWLSDFEILEIYQQISKDPLQQGPNTVTKLSEFELRLHYYVHFRINTLKKFM